jgi:hypothetical protein
MLLDRVMIIRTEVVLLGHTAGSQGVIVRGTLMKSIVAAWEGCSVRGTCPGGSRGSKVRE